MIRFCEDFPNNGKRNRRNSILFFFLHRHWGRGERVICLYEGIRNS